MRAWAHASRVACARAHACAHVHVHTYAYSPAARPAAAAGPSTTGGGRHWPQPDTYDPRRRAVARSACRSTRHHRGGVPPLQPGPQAPRAGHTDRSLSLAAWQTVTRARPAAVAVAPFDAPLLRHAPASAAAATREVAVAPATSPFLRQPPPLPDGHRHYCSRHSGRHINISAGGATRPPTPPPVAALKTHRTPSTPPASPPTRQPPRSRDRRHRWKTANRSIR